MSSLSAVSVVGPISSVNKPLVVLSLEYASPHIAN